MIIHELKNACLQFSRWEDLPAEVQDLFARFLGGQAADGQAFYQLYFYWFNVVHALGLALRAQYRGNPGKPWEEEMAASQFAVAFWRAKGQARRLLELEMQIQKVLARIPDPVPANEDRAVYLEKHYHELEANPGAFGHYLFSMTRASLAKPLDFPYALRTLVTPRASDGATIPLSPEYPLDSDLPFRVVDDVRRTLRAYGVHLPEIQVICLYSPALQSISWE